jgi:dolichol-phosphate mannosyltransferase
MSAEGNQQSAISNQQSPSTHHSPLTTHSLLVTLATYNERENLPELVRAITEVEPNLEILVIDDNSPDGTGELADQMAAADPRIHVLHRPGKLGLGTATIAGMRYAIEHGYEFVLNMDADFSHHPRYIPALRAGMGEHDVMIGSRYVPGGGVPDWPLKRRLMSKAVNTYARWLLGVSARDTSGAFRCYRVECLKRIDFDKVLSRGYSFQEEMLYLCRRAGCRMGETPIVFEDRRYGASKINRAEAFAAIGIILRLGVRRLLGR